MADTRARRMTHRELGMMVSLASMGMLFGTLLLSYLLARARSPVWPPIGIEPVPILLPALSTFLLMLSSVFIHRSYKELCAGRAEAFRQTWKRATLHGVAFVLLQIGVLQQLYRLGVKINTHIYGSIVYTLIIFHAVHVIAGLVTLLWIVRHFNRYTSENSEGPRLVGWFWHFLGAVWLMMFVLIVWR